MLTTSFEGMRTPQAQATQLASDCVGHGPDALNQIVEDLRLERLVAVAPGALRVRSGLRS